MLLVLVAGVISALVLMRGAQVAVALAEVQQLDYYEGVVYDNAARVLRHEPLYRPIDRPPYSVAAYMPMYPLLTAGLRDIFGAGFAPGRGLSVIAGLIAAYCIGHISTAVSRQRASGLLAAGLFLALAFPGVVPWLAMYRVDMLGVGFSLASIALLQGRPGLTRIVTAAILASLAILTKQLLFGAALAGAVWLLQRDRRMFALFGGIIAAVVGLTSLALEFSTHAFFANSVYSNVNPMRLDVLSANLQLYLLFQVGPLLAATLYILREHSGARHRDLLFLYWVASWLPMIGLAKAGAYHNYWIENAAITAVLASLGIWARRPAPGQTLGAIKARLGGGAQAPLIALVLSLPLSGLLVLAGGIAALDDLARVSTQNATLAQVVERVRSEPGDVIAEPFDVAVLAGRPVLLEPVIFSILYDSGRWDATPLVHRICTGEIRLLVLNKPIENAQFTFFDVAWWPRPIIASLRKVMQLESTSGEHYLYTPRQDLSAAPCP